MSGIYDPEEWQAGYEAGVAAVVRDVGAVLDEFERMCDPAPYTTERALYERTRNALARHASDAAGAHGWPCPDHACPQHQPSDAAGAPLTDERVGNDGLTHAQRQEALSAFEDGVGHMDRDRA